MAGTADGAGPGGAARPTDGAGAPAATGAAYYGTDLAFVHHRGFGSHADGCAPGLLALLEPVRERDGVVLELGCGSGALTRHLVGAGHRVLASDASPAMLALAREQVPGATYRRIALPHDRLPEADAVVSVGHALNYLPDEEAIEAALAAIAGAVRPGGVLAVDLCDLRWAQVRRDDSTMGRVGKDWAIITEFTVPRPDRYVRDMTTFVRQADGTWRRGHERHVNVLVDTARIPPLLARHGLDAAVQASLGGYVLPEGLVMITGERAA